MVKMQLFSSFPVALFIDFTQPLKDIASTALTVSASAQEARTVEKNGLDAPINPQATTPGVLKKVKFAYRTNQLNGTDAILNAFSERLTLRSTGCISIKISSMADVHDIDNDLARTMLWDVVLDDTRIENGPIWFVGGNPGYWDTYNGNWWICGVPVGRHTIKVTFTNYDEGDTAAVRSRSLEIHYNK